MTILVFEDRGWEVATASWSAGSSAPKEVTLCYQWGADGISWFDSATGIARITLKMSMREFLARVSRGGIVDLRDPLGR